MKRHCSPHGILCLNLQSSAWNTQLFAYYNSFNYFVICTLLFHCICVWRLLYYLSYLFGILSLKKTKKKNKKTKGKTSWQHVLKGWLKVILWRFLMPQMAFAGQTDIGWSNERKKLFEHLIHAVGTHTHHLSILLWHIYALQFCQQYWGTNEKIEFKEIKKFA